MNIPARRLAIWKGEYANRAPKLSSFYLPFAAGI